MYGEMEGERTLYILDLQDTQPGKAGLWLNEILWQIKTFAFMSC